MIDRCNNPNHRHWHRYGGRGISVCGRWRNSFQDFIADMGPRPSLKHSIDRFPNKDGNYEPGNCRWATQTQQMRNASINRMIVYQGETLCLAEWAERLGMNKMTLQGRLDTGWSVEEAFTVPVPSNRWRKR
jgi:hypothetical protein